MKRVEDFIGQTVEARFKRINLRNYELHFNSECVAVLNWGWFFDAPRQIETAQQRWEFRRDGLIFSRWHLLNMQSSKPILELKPGFWGGRISDSSGQEFILKANNFLGTTLSSKTKDGREMIACDRIFSFYQRKMIVHLQSPLRNMGDASPLIVLSVYYLDKIARHYNS